MKSLSKLSVGQKSTVSKLDVNGPVKRKIMDMGITRGTDIKVIKIAPLGDPIQLSVRGYDLSIRKEDADKILVE